MLDENTNAVVGVEIETVDLADTGEIVSVFGAAVDVSNALTMLDDSALEVFSVSFAAAEATAEPPKMFAVLAACPNIVNGFCGGVGLADFGVADESCVKLKIAFGFSNGRFSLLPATAVIVRFGFSTSTFSIVAFAALLNENAGFSTLAGSSLEITGVSVLGFVVELNGNDACD